MKKTKVFVTGGHLSPAMAVIEKLQDDAKPIEIVFIGRKYSMEGDTAISQEIRVMAEKKIRFLPLTTGRLRRFISPGTFVSLMKIPFGFIQSFIYCKREKPDLIISFGGYVAVPVVITGWVLNIPSITHEQTKDLGLANKIISLFAHKICLTWPVSQLSAKNKYVVTGLPVRKDIYSPPQKPSFSVPGDKKILYILGGTTGSRTINRLTESVLPELLKHFIVIHQLGVSSIGEGLKTKKYLADNDISARYFPMSFVPAPDHAWILTHATIVVSRAGANIVAELVVTHAVAILLPIRWTAGEQQKNADYLVRSGSGIALDEQTVTGRLLLETILNISDNYKKYKDKANSLHMDNGTDNFVQEIYQLLKI